MPQLHRRDLFRTAGFAAASYSRLLGANERIRFGLIGAGGRGQYVTKHFLSSGAECAAICDVYAVRVDEASGLAPQAARFSDHRRLLDEVKDLDAVLIATPDHWHAAITIDAVNAGKDVYVEKPLTRTIEEGPEITRAVRVNNRVCQVGMQQRSGMHYWKAKEEYIDSGKLGQITLIQTVWHSGAGRPRPDRRRDIPLPSNLDWARYLGPVKWREWSPAQYFNFRAFLDFGGGKITDFFAHWGDAVHMMMGKDDPISCVAAGGVYVHQDGRDAPDTIHCLWEYGGGYTVTFESATGAQLPPYGIHFCGTEGRLFIDRKKYVFYPAEKDAPPVEFVTDEQIDVAHVQNFLDCVRTRKRPNGDVWLGHRGAMAAHLGVIAYKQRRRLRFDPNREEILPL
jgi:predicted dehydrogenase